MSEKTKLIVIEDRKFIIKKFDAKTSLKMTKLIIAKILPVFEQLTGSITAENVRNIQTNLNDVGNALNIDSIVKALNLVSDEDMDKIIDSSLRNCFELLPAGQMPVLGIDGTYAVPDIEDDAILVMRLTAEALMWSISGFFDVSRLSSVLKPLADSLLPNA